MTFDNTHEHKHEKEHENKHKHVNCPVTAHENISITLPITVHAHADVEDIVLKCNGHDIIKESHCRRHVRKIKIRQKIQLCVPINFIAECETGEEHVEFESGE